MQQREKRDKTLNVYTVKDVGKYLPKSTKEAELLEEKTGMKLTHHALICGSTNSGKSNTLMNFIHRSSGVFDKIVMVAQKEEPFNKLLKDKLKDDIMFYIGDNISKLPDVAKLPDLDPDTPRYILLIFDDLVGENKHTQIVNRYFKFGRAKGCMILFLTQSYKSGGQMMSFIRKQCSYILMCGIKSQSELEDICKDYAMGDITPYQMAKMYQYCKKDEDNGEIDFMKICTYHTKPDKKISCNFLDYLDPRDFPDEKPKRGRKKKVESESENDE
jgi:hypothetical protein